MKTRWMNRALATLVAAARVRWLQARCRIHNNRFGVRISADGERIVRLANIAEGTHEGNITKGADAAITERWLLG